MNTEEEQSNIWHTNSIDEMLQHIESDIDQGLSQEEAKKRLKEYGLNQLTAKKKSNILQLFLMQMKDALIYVLLGAVIITFFMGEYIDGIIILAVVIINGVLGVVQEIKAGNAIEALQKMASPKALVKRDGQQFEIPATELVIGDLIILDAGRVVAADLRLTESANLQIDESALTGESVAVEKDAQATFDEKDIDLGDRLNMAYMSTLVTYGRGEGIVVHTANETEVGKIADIIRQEEAVKTPLEIRLNELGKTIGKLAIGVCLIMFAIGIIQGRDLVDMFLTAVSLAVASIPEGMAAIVAVVLSIGVTKMAKQNAIIKKLPAVETLGSVNIVCSDKTGTLTQNKMEVTQLFTFSDLTLKIEKINELSKDSELLIKGMVLASDATLENEKSTGDPTEIALLMLADEMEMDRKAIWNDHPRKDELAFDSKRKMMSTLHVYEDEFYLFTKGAIDSLVEKCSQALVNNEIVELDDRLKKDLLDAADEMSNNALRTLAIAYKPLKEEIEKEKYEENLIMVGLVGMIDPPREEVKDSIHIAKSAGITTIMITGDHKNTAFAIAQELGISDGDPAQVITGAELNRISEEELSKDINDYKVFARVSPEHKVKIVKTFKKNGNIVSMTGDGVNDAPSLNAADIGVAMGITGTDVAKNASDMILADDNFSTIIAAIEQGRNIYNNIKKSVLFLLSSNAGEVIAMLVSIAIGMPAPLIATQLLWINLVTDTLPAIALGMDPGSEDVMNDKPRDAKESFFSGGAINTIIWNGLIIGALTILAFWLGFYKNGYSPFDNQIPEEVVGYARSLAFLTIISCQLFLSLSFRHHSRSIFKVGIFSNVYLIGAIVVGFLLQLMVFYIPGLMEAFKLQPLNIYDWLLVLGIGIIPLIKSELLKVFKRMRKNGL